MLSYNETPNYLVPYLIIITAFITVCFIVICRWALGSSGEKTTCNYCKKPHKKTGKWRYSHNSSEDRHEIPVCKYSFCQNLALISGYLIV